MDGTNLKLMETLEEWLIRPESAKASGIDKQFPLTLAVKVSARPTPTVEGNNNHKGLSPTSGDGLGTAVKAETPNWPTPTVADRKGATRGKGAQGSLPLAEAVRERPGSARPTTSASLHNDAEDPAEWLARAETLKAKHANGNGAGMPLAVAAKLSQGLPRATPTARDHKDGACQTANVETNGLLGRMALEGTTTGALSADWVEALMGFPAGWTSTPTDGQPVAAKRSTRGSRPARRRKSRSADSG